MEGRTENLERAALRLDDVGPMDLAALRGEEALSTLFRYEAVCRIAPDRAAPSPGALLARGASITIRDAFGGQRTIAGIVTEAEVTPHEDGGATLALVVQPRAHVLTLGRDARTFRDLDCIGIAKDVFSRNGIDARFEIAGDHPIRAYTAQYRESDWAFVSRLFEEDGVYTWFDHEAGSILVVADRSPSAPDLAGGAKITYRPELGLSSAREHVVELGALSRLAPSKVALGSFDAAKPSFKVHGAHGEDGGIEVYDAPGAGHADPAVVETRARVRLEAVRAEAALLRGRSPCVRLAAGRAFELEGHAFGRHDGRYVVVATRFSLEHLGWARSGESTPIDVQFMAIPEDVPYRAPQRTRAPRHAGLQTGVVVGPPGDEVYPDAAGRIRLEQHWDANATGDHTGGHWARVAQRGTTGSMLIPRVGWNVLSLGEEGSVDVPHVLSRTFDGEHPPTYPLPAGKTRVAYKTATTPGGGSHNEIRFEDAKGSEEMLVHATGDLHVLVKDDKQETVHANLEHAIGQDHGLTVGGTYDVYVKGNQTVRIGGDASEKVAAARARSVGGDERTKIGGGRSLSTGANLESTAKERKVRVGAAQIDVTLGGFDTASSVVSTLVGGAVVKATPRAMSESVGMAVSASTAMGKLPKKASMVASLPGVSGALGAALSKIPSAQVGAAVQTIGVAKLELASAREIHVAKSYTETVLGMMTLKSLVSLGELALTKLELEAMALVGKAKKVSIESPASVTVKCGGATLTVSAKEGIKLDAPQLELDDASVLTAKAPAIHHDG